MGILLLFLFVCYDLKYMVEFVHATVYIKFGQCKCFTQSVRLWNYVLLFQYELKRNFPS